MADAVDLRRGDGGQDRLHVDHRGGQQGLSQGGAQLRDVLPQVGVFHVKDLPHQGVAVGVEAAGGQSQDHIPRPHGGRVQDGVLLHDAHGETGQVIVLRGHGAGVLGGLAADEGAARLAAALRHAGDQLLHPGGVVASDGQVIQEEEGLCPAADDVVDAHGHAVDAHGVVLAHELGDALLGAHTVGPGDQDGLAHPGGIRGEEAAEAADAGEDAGGKGPLHVLSHALHALIPGLDVHARLAVAFRIASHASSLSLMGHSKRSLPPGSGRAVG